MAVSRHERTDHVTKDEWMLTAEQMLFMLQNHNSIETAFAEDNLESLRQLAGSEEFLTLFGEMSFDEAYDRYETMLEYTTTLI
ncbi:MAG: hypothetical protein HZC41_11765 [Chloroflexi bacterium]|nr:hypothetical protein [Chloroflexota bacterium]